MNSDDTAFLKVNLDQETEVIECQSLVNYLKYSAILLTYYIQWLDGKKLFLLTQR